MMGLEIIFECCDWRFLGRVIFRCAGGKEATNRAEQSPTRNQMTFGGPLRNTLRSRKSKSVGDDDQVLRLREYPDSSTVRTRPSALFPDRLEFGSV
jgi:hypothetical protein